MQIAPEYAWLIPIVAVLVQFAKGIPCLKPAANNWLVPWLAMVLGVLLSPLAWIAHGSGLAEDGSMPWAKVLLTGLMVGIAATAAYSAGLKKLLAKFIS